MTRISVVMITCEGERWVAAQARSIAEQHRLPDEIIIADDASRDGTIDVALHALGSLEPRCVVLPSDVRRGVTGNLERGLRRASGEVVVLADQDDVWLPSKLTVVENWARSGTGGAMFSDGWIIDGEGRRTGSRLFERVGLDSRCMTAWDRDPLGVVLRHPVVTGATMALRREELNRFLPLPRQGWHDYSLSLLFASTSGLYLCRSPLIEYRLHGSNAAGLPPTKRPERVLDADVTRRNGLRQAAQFAELATRIEAHPQSIDDRELQRFWNKVVLLSMRANLPSNRVARLPTIFILLAGRRYHRYGQGFASAARDALWP